MKSTFRPCQQITQDTTLAAGFCLQFQKLEINYVTLRPSKQSYLLGLNLSSDDWPAGSATMLTLAEPPIYRVPQAIMGEVQQVTILGEINYKRLLSHRSTSGALSHRTSQPLRSHTATPEYEYWIKYDGVQNGWIEPLTAKLVLNRDSGACRINASDFSRHIPRSLL